MAKEIPVYLFVGFLESGKTKFIQETFEDPSFDSGDKTLLLVCEEGEEEYKPEKFAFPGTSVRVLEDKDPEEYQFEYDPTVISAEYCEESGLLAGENCTKTSTGWYQSSRVPGICHEEHKAEASPSPSASPSAPISLRNAGNSPEFLLPASSRNASTAVSGRMMRVPQRTPSLHPAPFRLSSSNTGRTPVAGSSLSGFPIASLYSCRI